MIYAMYFKYLMALRDTCVRAGDACVHPQLRCPSSVHYEHFTAQTSVSTGQPTEHVNINTFERFRAILVP